MKFIPDSIEKHKTNLFTAAIVFIISFVLFTALRFFFRNDFDASYSSLASLIVLVAYFVFVRVLAYLKRDKEKKP